MSDAYAQGGASPVPGAPAGPETTDRLTAPQLRARLSSTQARFNRAIEVCRQAGPGFVAWSGGKDSTVVADLMQRAQPGYPLVLWDSGLEYPETLAYVRDTAEARGWPLTIVECHPTALEIMVAWGLWDLRGPAPEVRPLHLQEAVVTRPAEESHRRFGNVGVNGLRAEESAVRYLFLAKTRGSFTRRTGREMLSPIWSWRQPDVWAYLADRGIEPNPVYAKLSSMGAPQEGQRVGLMIDGNALGFGRGVWLRRGWPEEWRRIAAALPRLREFS